MALLQKAYRLDGDDQTPRAYLDGVQELLTEQIDSREGRFDHTPTQLEKRTLRGEITGLELARSLVESVILGLECEHVSSEAS